MSLLGHSCVCVRDDFRMKGFCFFLPFKSALFVWPPPLPFAPSLSPCLSLSPCVSLVTAPTLIEDGVVFAWPSLRFSLPSFVQFISPFSTKC